MNLPVSSITYLFQLISEKSDILITTHYNPDGDAIGSSMALYHFLKSQGAQVNVMIPNELPSFLEWLPGCNQVVNYSENPAFGNELIYNAELIFCMDYNGLGRVKLFSNELKSASATRILIDHHIKPENEFDLSFSDTAVSSTSELLYRIIQAAGYQDSVSKEIAECIFVGIMTDTGSFSYSCNQSDTFRIVANLIDCGIDVEKIHRLVYDTYSESRMRLLGHCLSTNMKVMAEHATAYIWLTKQDLELFSYKQGDTEGVVNYALSINNVAVAALFTERGDRIRVSLRSKGEFSVNDFARQHCNGGGHKNAAGGDVFKTMEETLAWFEQLLPQYSNEIRQALANYK